MSVWLTTPSADINYTFVLGAYVVGMVLCFALSGMQLGGVETVNGFWLIFLPFVFGVPYMAFLRSKQSVLAVDKKAAEKKSE